MADGSEKKVAFFQSKRQNLSQFQHKNGREPMACRHNTIVLHPGLLASYGKDIEVEAHRHSAVQIVWPDFDQQWRINGQQGSGLLLIASDVLHDLQLSAGWILLLEPQSTAGQAALTQLAQAQSKTRAPLPIDSSAETALAQFAALWQWLDIDPDQCWQSAVADPRLHKLLDELDQCLAHECLKPAQWRAQSVAAQLALSQSRFLHLFRAEMGIAWRPYLLWRRLLCAIHALAKGKSATDAALTAGFSDSAHLSRTFRKTLGLSIRQASAMFLRS